MNLRSVITLTAIVVLGAGCSCSRSRSIGTEPNIAVAEEGVGPLKDVYFNFDSASLDESAKSTLTMNAEWLKSNTDARVQIEGHCDERGTNEYNMALGARRAQSAYDYLKNLGVESSRMSTISYGEELPLDPSHNEVAWAKNRRVHHKVVR